MCLLNMQTRYLKEFFYNLQGFYFLSYNSNCKLIRLFFLNSQTEMALNTQAG